MILSEGTIPLMVAAIGMPVLFFFAWRIIVRFWF